MGGPPIPTSFQKSAGECLLLATLIVAVQIVGMRLLGSGTETGIFHPLAGIGAGWLLARGLRAWPGIWLGTAVADALISFERGTSLSSIDSHFVLTNLSLGFADLLNALVVYWIARTRLSSPITLLRPREIVLFIWVILPAGSLGGTGWDYLTVRLLETGSAEPAWQVLCAEFVSTTLGSITSSVLVLLVLGSPRDVWQRRKSMVIFLPVIYFGVVWGATAVGGSMRNAREAEFRSLITDAVAELELERANYEMIASAVTAFYASSNLVERSEFESFVGELLARAPDVQAVTWQPRVRRAERAAFEAAAIAEGLGGYRITERADDGQKFTAGEREEYFPVLFIEPLAGNQISLGFDSFSEGARRSAMFRARQTGRVTATEPLRLAPARSAPSVLLFAPILSNSTGELMGFISVIVDATKLCARVGESLKQEGVQLSVTDLEAPSSHRLLYSTLDSEDSSSETKATLREAQEIAFVGRRWRAEAVSSDVYLAGRSPWEFFAQYGAFALLTALLVAGQLYTSGRDLLVDAEVRERSAELQRAHDRMRQLVDGAPTALLAVSARGSIVMANRRAVELFGYAQHQLLGHSPNILLTQSRDGGESVVPDVVELREHDGGLPRILHCTTAQGARLSLIVRQSTTSTMDGSQLTIVAFHDSPPFPRGGTA